MSRFSFCQASVNLTRIPGASPTASWQRGFNKRNLCMSIPSRVSSSVWLWKNWRGFGNGVDAFQAGAAISVYQLFNTNRARTQPGSLFQEAQTNWRLWIYSKIPGICGGPFFFCAPVSNHFWNICGTFPPQVTTIQYVQTYLPACTFYALVLHCSALMTITFCCSTVSFQYKFVWAVLIKDWKCWNGGNVNK